MSEITVIDADNGIWIVEIPVNCQTRGHLVLCNEESIGYVEPFGPDDYAATATSRGHARGIGGYRKIHQAARAVAHEVLGDIVFMDHLSEDASDVEWDETLDRYIEFGPKWMGNNGF